MRKNNRAARAAHTLVHLYDVVCHRKSLTLYVYLNGASTSPFAAVCSFNNKECEEEAVITKFPKSLLSNDVFAAVAFVDA